MSYPGNSSLPSEIQQRILATFEQTLELAGKGNQQEALLGCDFILRLDPLFDPARKLQGRLEQMQGPVDVSDLTGEADEGGSETSFSDLDNLSLDTQVGPVSPAHEVEEAAPTTTPPPPPEPAAASPKAPEPPAPGSRSSSHEAPEPHEVPEAREAPNAGPLETPEPPAPPTNFDALATKLEQLLAERHLDELQKALAQAPAEAQAQPRIAALLAQAQEAIEAEPYVQSFLERARQDLSAGHNAEATQMLEKARALDPEHPGISEVEALAAQKEAPEPAAPQAPSAAPPTEAASQAPSATPSTEAAPGAGLDLNNGVDLTGGSGNEDDDPRITELLKEGQTAFDQANYQGAIDAWSRIFLINIDHAEANRRIEIARKMKAEGEREIEQHFHEALAHADAGENEEAIAGLKKVLELSPGHMAAREALEGLESGQAPAAPAPEDKEESDSDIDLGLSDLDLSEDGKSEAAQPLKHQILVPPEPGEESAATTEESAATTVAVKSSGARRRFIAIGAVVFLAVAAVGWFLYTNRGRLFHNTSATPAQSTTTADPVTRAKELAKQGKTDLALTVLRRMPPSDPQYSEAQVLIAQWEAAKKPQQPAQSAGPAPAELAARDQWLESARNAANAGEFLLASNWLAKAASIAPLKGDAARLKATCDTKLASIEPEIDLFRQGEWELALPRLWRLHQVQPDNKTVTRLIVDSYYDLGVRDLQREEVKDALSKFNEAVKLAPADVMLQRLVSFCKTYRSRSPDLLYQIFVKYLPFR